MNTARISRRHEGAKEKWARAQKKMNQSYNGRLAISVVKEFAEIVGILCTRHGRDARGTVERLGISTRIIPPPVRAFVPS